MSLGFGSITLEAAYIPKSSMQTIKVNRIEYVDVMNELGRYNMTPSWIVRGKRLRMQRSSTRIDFEAEKRDVSVNGVKVFMGDAVYARSGKLHISAQDFEKVIVPILRAPKAKTPKIIMLDPGHGGKDTGTINNALGIQEKKYALDLALRVRRRLTEQGYQVVMTRTNDTYPSLEARPKLAEQARADLFVSIHLNSVDDSSVKGIETFVVTPQHQRSTSRKEINGSAVLGNRNDELNTLLGYHIHSKLIQQTKAVDRGVKRARFVVISQAKMPGVLIEAGFVSNTAEARKIMTVAYREQLASAIVDGINAYRQALRN